MWGGRDDCSYGSLSARVCLHLSVEKHTVSVFSDIITACIVLTALYYLNSCIYADVSGSEVLFLLCYLSILFFSVMYFKRYRYRFSLCI